MEKESNGKKPNPLKGMMINKGKKVLIRDFTNGNLGGKRFLEKGLEELRQAYGSISGEVLTNYYFNEALATYNEMVMIIGKRMDVSAYEDARDKFIEDIETLEEEISKKSNRGIARRKKEHMETALRRALAEEERRVSIPIIPCPKGFANWVENMGNIQGGYYDDN